MDTRELNTKEIKDLLGRPVAFYPALVPICGGVAPALMVCQALYWTSRTGNADGWFYKTREQWEREVGLTRKEQETARRYLGVTDFWNEKRGGCGNRLHFRLQLGPLKTAIQTGKRPNPNYRELDDDDPDEM